MEGTFESKSSLEYRSGQWASSRAARKTWPCKSSKSDGTRYKKNPRTLGPCLHHHTHFCLEVHTEGVTSSWEMWRPWVEVRDGYRFPEGSKG